MLTKETHLHRFTKKYTVLDSCVGLETTSLMNLGLPSLLLGESTPINVESRLGGMLALNWAANSFSLSKVFATFLQLAITSDVSTTYQNKRIVKFIPLLRSHISVHTWTSVIFCKSHWNWARNKPTSLVIGSSNSGSKKMPDGVTVSSPRTFMF